MPIRREFVPPALIASTLALIGCAMGWGALGMVSFADPDKLPIAEHRYLCMLLATVTLGSAMVYLAARIVHTIHDAAGVASDAGAGDEVPADGYAAGYAAGLAARPAVRPEVTRLMPARR